MKATQTKNNLKHAENLLNRVTTYISHNTPSCPAIVILRLCMCMCMCICICWSRLAIGYLQSAKITNLYLIRR